MAAPSTNYTKAMAALNNLHAANYGAFYATFSADNNQPTNAAL
jgi:hypothetical protein